MIKHYSKILLTFLFIFTLLGSNLNAQDYTSTPVTISKEKVRIDGKLYYSHIVLERQTLYSIAKTYNVTIDQIYEVNPNVKELGLQKNSIILIPYVKGDEVKAVQEESEETDVVVQTSPGTKENVFRKAITHIVKWFEDIESIAKTYAVTVEDIMKANNLKDRKLSRRQKLYIPSEEELAQAKKEEKQELQDTTKVVFPSLDEILKPAFESKNEVTAALILPYKSNTSSVSRNNMDMLCGAMLAAYELGKQGIKLDLKTYDSSAESIRKDMIKSCDFIIGPMFSEQIQAIYSKYPEVCPIISPLHPMTEALALDYVNFIHAPTPQKVQYEDMIVWAMEEMQTNDKLIVISEKTGGQDIYKTITSTLDKNNIKYSKYSYSILESRAIEESLKTLFTQIGTNRVIVASESEAFVNDAVKNINILSEKHYDIALYGPSKIRAFETVNIANYHNTNLHLVSSFDINYDSEEVKDFLLKYRALYNTEPSQFAFQGYDLIIYFTSLCAKYGDSWIDYVELDNRKLLQTNFSFEKVENGGYINVGTKRSIFEKNFKTIEVTP